MLEKVFQIISALAVIGGVWMTYWTYINNKRLEIFQEYIDKYNAIITPQDLKWWIMALQGESIPEDKVDQYEVKMIEYLNLVWEEYHLMSRKLISKKLWQAWEPNIKQVLSSEFAQEVIKKYDFYDLSKKIQ